MAKFKVLMMIVKFRRETKKLPKFEVPLNVKRAAEKQGWKFN